MTTSPEPSQPYAPCPNACYLAGRCQCPPPAMPYELPDFHPETGHLHTCADRAICDCAAWLYCIAQDAEMAAPQLAATAQTSPGGAE